MNRRILLVLPLLLICGACADEAPGPQTTPPRPAPVTLQTMKREARPRTTRKTAILQSRVDLDLVAEGAGLVRERVAVEGAAVGAGNFVLFLECDAEESALSAALTHHRDLAASGAPRSRCDEAAAALAQAREMLRRRTVIAPKDGVLDRYYVDPGEWVVPGMRVARLVDRTRLYCIATVLEEEVLHVDRDGTARFTTAAAEGETFSARVVRIGEGALAGGEFEVELEVETDPRLRPGFLATLALPLQGREEVLSLPREAVFTRHGAERVFVAREEAGVLVVAERGVRVRPVPGNPVLVDVIEGLADGDRVVVRGRLGLAAGRAIVPETAGEDR